MLSTYFISISERGVERAKLYRLKVLDSSVLSKSHSRLNLVDESFGWDAS